MTIDELTLRQSSGGKVGDPWDTWFKGTVDITDAALRAGVKFTEVDARLDVEASGGPYRATELSMDVFSPSLRLSRRLMENTTAHFVFDPAVNGMVVDAEGSMYGGLVSANGLIGVGEAVDFEVDLQFADIGLGAYAGAGENPPETELEGGMFGRLMLSGDRRDRTTLIGRGSVRIADARIPPL